MSVRQLLNDFTAQASFSRNVFIFYLRIVSFFSEIGANETLDFMFFDDLEDLIYFFFAYVDGHFDKDGLGGGNFVDFGEKFIEFDGGGEGFAAEGVRTADIDSRVVADSCEAAVSFYIVFYASFGFSCFTAVGFGNAGADRDF